MYYHYLCPENERPQSGRIVAAVYVQSKELVLSANINRRFRMLISMSLCDESPSCCIMRLGDCLFLLRHVTSLHCVSRQAPSVRRNNKTILHQSGSRRTVERVRVILACCIGAATARLIIGEAAPIPESILRI